MNEKEPIRGIRPQDECKQNSQSMGTGAFAPEVNPIIESMRKSLTERRWANERERQQIEQAVNDLNDETVQKILRILHLARM
jgi:hypothetical protein